MLMFVKTERIKLESVFFSLNLWLRAKFSAQILVSVISQTAGLVILIEIHVHHETKKDPGSNPFVCKTLQTQFPPTAQKHTSRSIADSKLTLGVSDGVNGVAEGLTGCIP